jgi:pimeloyl-ACP methyl ester carboxylesterase
MLGRSLERESPRPEPLDWVEEAFPYGEDGRGLSILTLPGRKAGPAEFRPVVILLNAGLLNRTGPNRLYVRMARVFAELGCASLRVDLTGRGDTPVGKSTIYDEATFDDYAAIKTKLNSRFGPAPIVLVGLCSGSDDAIRFAQSDPDVKGMILLDPVAFKDANFVFRSIKNTILECLRMPGFHVRLLWRRIEKVTAGQRFLHPFAMRKIPSLADTRRAMSELERRGGRALLVYTRFASFYYNRPGQLKAALGRDETDPVCDEVYWPDVTHTYVLDVHRRRLLETVGTWMAAFLDAAGKTIEPVRMDAGRPYRGEAIQASG